MTLTDFDLLVLYTAKAIGNAGPVPRVIVAGGIANELECPASMVVESLVRLVDHQVMGRATWPGAIGWWVTDAGHDLCHAYRGPDAAEYAPVARAHRDGVPVYIGPDRYRPGPQGRWVTPSGRYVCGTKVARALAASNALRAAV